MKTVIYVLFFCLFSLLTMGIIALILATSRMDVQDITVAGWIATTLLELVLGSCALLIAKECQ